MTRPLVSLLMPVYNAAPFVELAIGSVLAQTYRKWELIVIDDGSTDNTADRVAAIADQRIRLLRHTENLGLPARLNQAVREARGSLLARMDGDDIAFPGRLERQAGFLLRHPLVDLVATDMLIIGCDGTPAGRERWRGADHRSITAKPWGGFHLNHATWMGRAGFFRRFAYDVRAHRCEDDDLILRAYRTSRFHRLREVHYAYRLGPLDAQAVWTARSHYMRSLSREAVRSRDVRLLYGIPAQIAKGTAERGAAALGLTGLVTGHRNNEMVSPELVRVYESHVRKARELVGGPLSRTG
ncbi:MAG: glycosyltransferase family 2 protein [Rhodothermales bacterium]|nr:glycosyltransferase family 2 protein [Rhodothermales bacterium]MBO6780750.1 glycosyltransferase family 2 protein [Rhodothermales bacterium]